MVVWDVISGAPSRSWKAHSGRVVSVYETSDVASSRRWAVSGGGTGIVRIWDLHAAANATDERIQHNGCVTRLAASPDGRVFVSASSDETLRIWNAIDGTPVGGALCGHNNVVTCVSVSPDSRRLVSGSRDWTVRMWDVATGLQVGDALRGHGGWVNCVAYSGDGRFVVSGSDDSTVRIWSVIDSPQVSEGVNESRNLLPPNAMVLFQNYHRDDVRMAEPGVREELSSRESLRLEMILNHELPFEERSPGNWVNSVTISPDGQRVLSGLDNGEIWVWNTSSRECTYRTKLGNAALILQIQISEMNEVVTTNELYEEFRWRLDHKGGLTRVLEHDETKAAQAELQAESVSDGLNSVLCYDHFVALSGGKRIATLPDDVMYGAWKYNPQRRVLCVGLKDGRVLFFQVKC